MCVGDTTVCRDGIAHQVEQRAPKKCKDGGNLGRLHDAYIDFVCRWLILYTLHLDKRLDQFVNCFK